MRVINAFKIAIGNFGLVFKNILYKTIIFALFATAVWFTLNISLTPFIEQLKPVLQDVAEIIKALLRGQSGVSATNSSNLTAHFNEFLAYISANVGSIVIAALICVLIVYLYRFFAGLSDCTLMILVDGHMSSLSHRGYLGVMFENLKKIVVYQLIDAVLAIVYYAVVFFVEFILFKFLAPYLTVIVVFLGVCILVFSVGIYSSCLSQVMANMIVGGLGVKQAFIKGLHPGKKYFWRMFSAYLSVNLIYVYLFISMGVFTLGAGSVLIAAFFTLMTVCMRLIDYYTINVKRYFIDYDNIVVPKELRENDEQLLNDVEI